MMYLGLISFSNSIKEQKNIISAVESFVGGSCGTIQKNLLFLCYGKLEPNQDMDLIWENETSILLGHFFPKISQPPFSERDFRNAASLSKEIILDKIWGKYVYIHTNSKESRVEVVIDSTGQLPFFYYIFPNGDILFSSHIELIFKTISVKHEYNWSYLHSYLIYGMSCAIETPFKNVHELPPSCCLVITKNKLETNVFWNPLQSYKTPIISEKDPVEVLESILKPWIAPYKNICVSLSGGLESSTLTYCLNKIKKKEQVLFAISLFHSSVQSSNELKFARKVCQDVGIELIEADAADSLPFDRPQKAQKIRPNKPSEWLINLRWTEAEFGYLSSFESCVLLNGLGGDHTFMCPPTKMAVADYILEKGFKGSQEKLKNLTHLYRDSIFQIIKQNMIGLSSYFFAHRLGKRNKKTIQNELPHWIKIRKSQQDLCDFEHPIYKNLPSRLLPGKYEQIDALYEGLAAIQVEADPTRSTFYPFLYQPIVEFALGIPTYNLFAKGYDRYPLRKAASDHFHTDAVWRRDKGETTGIFQLGLKKNLEYVLDLCLNGQLVKQNLIDKEGLRKTIQLISNGDIDYIWSVTHLASIEIFLEYWKEKCL